MNELIIDGLGTGIEQWHGGFLLGILAWMGFAVSMV
jgi:hypothetical protein